MTMNQQAARMQQADVAQRSACANGSGQECTGLAARFQSEASLYQTFKDRYQQCRQPSTATKVSGRVPSRQP